MFKLRLYIDIILVDDDDAARNVTFVEIPALEGGDGHPVEEFFSTNSAA